MNRHFEALFETGVDEMSWDDTVSEIVVIFTFYVVETTKEQLKN